MILRTKIQPKVPIKQDYKNSVQSIAETKRNLYKQKF